MIILCVCFFFGVWINIRTESRMVKVFELKSRTILSRQLHALSCCAHTTKHLEYPIYTQSASLLTALSLLLPLITLCWCWYKMKMLLCWFRPKNGNTWTEYVYTILKKRNVYKMIIWTRCWCIWVFDSKFITTLL